MQASANEIDHDIKVELQFYKQETARLQAEMNANKHKMVMNEKNVKAANKEKNDAVIGTQVLKS